MAHQAGHEHDVAVAVADDLVGDVDAAALDVAGLRRRVAVAARGGASGGLERRVVAQDLRARARAAPGLARARADRPGVIAARGTRAAPRPGARSGRAPATAAARTARAAGALRSAPRARPIVSAWRPHASSASILDSSAPSRSSSSRACSASAKSDTVDVGERGTAPQRQCLIEQPIAVVRVSVGQSRRARQRRAARTASGRARSGSTRSTYPGARVSSRSDSPTVRSALRSSDSRTWRFAAARSRASSGHTSSISRVGRHDAIRVEQQQRQDRAGARAADRQRPLRGADLQRTKDVELHERLPRNRRTRSDAPGQAYAHGAVSRR